MHDFSAVMSVFNVEGLLLGQSILALVWDKVWPVLAIFLGFSVIIFVHELGHFAVAKWCDVRVEKFAIGFGREIWGFTRGETRYSFNLLPMGGYVKMLGQEDFDDKTLELKAKNDPRSFANKSVGQRAAVVSAGVIMNLIFAFILFMIVFLVGIEAKVPRIGLVMPDSPADRAGLRAGDLVREVNGADIRDWIEVATGVALAPPFEPVEFYVDRAGERLGPILATPEDNPLVGYQTIGIQPPMIRRITQVPREFDAADESLPRIGDELVEVDGQPVTPANVNEMFALLALRDSFVVERRDPKNPSAPATRVPVRIEPQIQFISGDPGDRYLGNLLGLMPLVRLDNVMPKQRAAIAGLDEGDTILMWDDIQHPTQRQVMRSTLDNPDQDIAFIVRTAEGRTRHGFVRPAPVSKTRGTIQAWAEPTPQSGEDTPKARLVDVRPKGSAARAGLAEGDLVVAWNDERLPTAYDINRDIEFRRTDAVELTVRKPDGREVTARIPVAMGGMIQALPQLIAHDNLTVAGVLPTLDGRPSPAAVAGIPAGAVLKSVAGRPVVTWRQVILAFREHAGRTVDVEYAVNDQRHTAALAIPPTLRTVLALGLEANFVSVAGESWAAVTSVKGTQDYAVSHAEGLAALLRENVNREVEVRFRRTPTAPVESANVTITPDMIDPWDSRIAFKGEIYGDLETFILRESNPISAIELGVRKTHEMVMQVYQTIDRMAFSRSISADSISGPVGIVSLGGNVARRGTMQLLFFLAVLSANLAVINFLPLPIVDGGLMVFLLIEKIKGSPVNMKVQVITQTVGIILIVTAFLYVTFNDVVRLFN